MRIKLPASLDQAKATGRKGAPLRHEHPARDLKPTVRTDLSRRPTTAPRRGGY
ncbi:hypothetical protein [Nonomuraea candida]|uniref:hypothetical protein n=1 Tax=Nonomuraea candida TaxID=359159 RepID=UPI000AC56C31|nr:hypothetical protein [Nonomuraea candida]